MDNLSEEEMLVLTIKTSTKEIDPQITMNLSEAETRELTWKTSSIEETATHQNEEEDYEGIERHKKTSLEDTVEKVERASCTTDVS
jgi:hypothetical protein